MWQGIVDADGAAGVGCVWGTCGGLLSQFPVFSQCRGSMAVWHYQAGSRGLGHAGVVEPGPHLLREGHKVGDAG